MTESESIRDAETLYEVEEAVYRAERYDDGNTPVRTAPRRLDDFTIELLAEADRLRAAALAMKINELFAAGRAGRRLA